MTGAPIQTETSRISSATGEFADPRVERRFRKEMMPDTIRQARILFLLGGTAACLFMVVGLLIWGGPDLAAFGWRAVSIAASAVAFWQIGRLRARHVEPLIVTWQVIVSVGFAAAASSHPATAVAAMFLLPAVFYLAVPTAFRTAVCAGMASSALMLLSYMTAGWEAGESAFLAVALVALNLILVPLKSRAGRQLRHEWASARAYRDALAELAASRSLLERTFAAVPTPLVVSSIETGEIVRTNAAAERFLGLEGRLVGRKSSSFYDDPADRKLLTERLGRDGHVSDIRTCMIAAGGARRTVLIAASSVGTADSGEGYMVASVQDVTDAEERERRLLLAEAEYRAHFENSVVGIYRSTPEGKMLRANPALVRLNGYETEAELVSSVNDIASEWYLEPGRREEWIRIMRESGLVTDFVSEVYRHKSRERIWISESGWLVRGPDGEPLHFEGTVIEVTERKRAEAETERLARHDALTDLPNRRLLSERLEQEIAKVRRHGGGFAVMCMDLDRFKAVNDAFGHRAGDMLLQEAARRLREACREEDVIARVGGDEFTLILPHVDDPECAASVAGRIVQEFGRPFDLGGPRALVGASIGIAMAPHDGTDQAELLSQADWALYQAKEEGRNRYRFCDGAAEAVRKPGLKSSSNR